MAIENDNGVRWFHSHMDGAPQMTAQEGNLVQILDACLVNGFGVKAPDGNKITISSGVATVEFSGGHDFGKYEVIEISGATPAALNDVWRVTGATATTFSFDCQGIPDGSATGSITVKRPAPAYWEKAFGDNLKAAYRSTHPEATGYYLRVDSTGVTTGGNQVRGYKQMADIDNGSGPFPDFSQQTNYVWQLSRSSPPETENRDNWALVASEKFFYFLPGFYVAGGAALVYFGDITKYADIDENNCCIEAHTVSAASFPDSGISSSRINSNAGLYLADLASPDISSGAVRAGHYGSGLSPNMAEGVFDALAPTGVVFFPNIVVATSDELRGQLPGLLQGGNKTADALEGHIAKINDQAPDGIPVLMVRMVGGYRTRSNIVGFDVMRPWG